MKRHLLLDFDGVVGDTLALNWSLVKQLHPEVLEDSYRVDHHLGNVYERNVVGFTPETSAAYAAFYNQHLSLEHVESSTPYIKRLAESLVLHVVSSNCGAAIARVLRDARMDHLFQSILGMEAGLSKVQKFLHLERVEDIDLSNALFITDTTGDVYEAEKVGLPVVAVSFGYHSRELLLTSPVRTVVDSWEELESYVERWRRS